MTMKTMVEDDEDDSAHRNSLQELAFNFPLCKILDNAWLTDAVQTMSML